MTARPHIFIYTDGGSSPNPGTGGWAAILVSGAHRKEIKGGEPNTTNNRMELMAAISALEALKKKPSIVEMHTDSQYVHRGISQYITYLETQRLEDRRQEAGEERRTLAAPGRSSRAASTSAGIGSKVTPATN